MSHERKYRNALQKLLDLSAREIEDLERGQGLEPDSPALVFPNEVNKLARRALKERTK